MKRFYYIIAITLFFFIGTQLMSSYHLEIAEHYMSTFTIKSDHKYYLIYIRTDLLEDKKLFLDTLTSWMKENNSYFNFYQLTDTKTRRFFYVNDTIYQDLPVYDYQHIDFLSHDTRYFTTDTTDLSASGYLYLHTKDSRLGPIFEDYPAYAILHMDVPLNTTFRLLIDSTKNVDDLVPYLITHIPNASEKSFRLGAEAGPNDTLATQLKRINQMLTIILLFTCAFLLIWSIIVFSENKKISILKLHGHSARRIFISKFGTLIVSTCALIVAVYTITFLLNMHSINSYSIAIGLQMLGNAIQTILLFLLLSLCILLYIKFLPTTFSLKNHSYSHFILNLNWFLKVIFLCFILLPLTTDTTLLLGMTSNLLDIPGMRKRTADFAYITDASNLPNGLSFQERIDEMSIFVALSQNGAVFIDDFEYRKEELLGTKPDKYQWFYSKIISVNGNYLLRNPIYDIDGKLVQIDESQDMIYVLVPEYIYHDVGFSEKLVKEKFGYAKVQFIITKNGQKTFSYHLEGYGPTGSSRYYDNPMITVTPFAYFLRRGLTKPMMYPNFFIPVKDITNYEAEIESYLATLDADGNYYYELYSDRIDRYYASTLFALINFLKNVGVFFIIIALFATQYINIFFEVNKKAIALQSIHGYPWLKRYQAVLRDSAIAYIVPLLYFVTIQKQPLLTGIAGVIGLFLLECLILCILIRINDKKNMLRTLKGD